MFNLFTVFRTAFFLNSREVSILHMPDKHFFLNPKVIKTSKIQHKNIRTYDKFTWIAGENGKYLRYILLPKHIQVGM